MGAHPGVRTPLHGADAQLLGARSTERNDAAPSPPSTKDIDMSSAHITINTYPAAEKREIIEDSQLRAQVHAEWNRDAALRQEFINLTTYEAYRLAESKGQIRRFDSKEI